MRLIPTVTSHALAATGEYDDGVHVGAAVRLLAGSVPYRDFVFLQPPGIAILLTPAAALAGMSTEAVAFVVAKVAFMLVGAIVAGLLCLTVGRRHGVLAGSASGMLYAVWAVTARTESTVLLEPLLNLVVVLALLLLAPAVPSRRRALSAGALLGAGISLKLWIAPVALLIGCWTLLKRGPTAGLRVASGAAVAALGLCAPFFVLAPRQMWVQVGLDQAGRGRGPSITMRLATIADESGHLHGQFDPTALAVSVAGAIAIALIVGVVRGARLWAALGALEVAMILASPAFYYHYAAFAALPLAALFGVALGAARELLPRPLRALVLVAASLLLVMLAGLAFRDPVPGSADRAALTRFARDRRCVWTDSASATLLAGVERQRSGGACHQALDLFGVRIDLARGRGLDDLERDRLSIPPWQRLTQEEMKRSDGALLTGPPQNEPWDHDTLRTFLSRFHLVENAGSVSVWSLCGYPAGPGPCDARTSAATG